MGGIGTGAGSRMTPDPIMLLGGLSAAPGSPKIVQSPLELDGYLTGVIVTPQAAPIRSPKWVAGLWNEDESIFDDTAVMKAVLDAVIERHNAITAEIDRSLDRLQAEKICDYQPLFLSGSTPSHASVRVWARGFWKAMTLAPDTWTALMKGERGQTLLRPLVGFFEADEQQPFDGEPPENLDEILDEDAAHIPQTILLLRKLARMRAAAKPLAPVVTRRPSKIGRNDPCPCGSGQKYKRCCAQN
jgi:uncharacterized protein